MTKHLSIGTLVKIKNHSSKTNGLLGYVKSRDGESYIIEVWNPTRQIHCYLCELEVAVTGEK